MPGRARGLSGGVPPLCEEGAGCGRCPPRSGEGLAWHWLCGKSLGQHSARQAEHGPVATPLCEKSKWKG